jgi:hypothetical protein
MELICYRTTVFIFIVSDAAISGFYYFRTH